MNYRSLAIAILLIGMALVSAGCEKTTEPATTTTSSPPGTTYTQTPGNHRHHNGNHNGNHNRHHDHRPRSRQQGRGCAGDAGRLHAG